MLRACGPRAVPGTPDSVAIGNRRGTLGGAPAGPRDVRGKWGPLNAGGCGLAAPGRVLLLLCERGAHTEREEVGPQQKPAASERLRAGQPHVPWVRGRMNGRVLYHGA